MNCSNITCEHSSPTPLANTLSRQSTQLFRRVNSSNHGPSVYYSVIGPWFKPQADMSLFHLSVSVEYVAASRPRHGPYIYRSCLSMISVDVKHHQCLLLLRSVSGTTQRWGAAHWFSGACCPQSLETESACKAVVLSIWLQSTAFRTNNEFSCCSVWQCWMLHAQSGT